MRSTCDNRKHGDIYNEVSNNNKNKRNGNSLYTFYQSFINLNSMEKVTQNDHYALQTLLDLMPAGIVMTGLDGVTTFVNQVANQIFEDSIIVGEKLPYNGSFRICRLDGSKYMSDELPLIRSMQKGEVIQGLEMLIIDNKGNEYIHLVSSIPIYDYKGNIMGGIVIFLDVTKMKRTEERLNENGKTLRVLLDGITGIIMLLDTKNIIITSNKALYKRLHISSEELISSKLFKFLSPELAASRKSKLNQLVRTGEPISIQDKDDIVHYNHQLFPVSDSQGKVIVAAFSHDIHSQTKIEKALHCSEEHFRSVFENSATGIALMTLDGHYFMVNRALCNIVGYTEEELSNLTFQEITHSDDIGENMVGFKNLLSGEIKSFQMEKRYFHKNKSIVWVLLSLALVNDSAGCPFYMIAQVQDITKSKKVEAELRAAKLEAEEARLKAESLASTDYLTGLLNRRAFMERLTDEAARAFRENAPVSLILTDIDYFKKVNDTYGHKIGDIVLQEISGCLVQACREYDFIGRYGGEEFIICLPNTTIDQANIVAERMRSGVEVLRISTPDNSSNIYITSSFGVASSTFKNTNFVNTLITWADEALYKAKTYGRNQVCLMENRCSC